MSAKKAVEEVSVQWCDFCGTTANTLCRQVHPGSVVERKATPWTGPLVVPAPVTEGGGT